MNKTTIRIKRDNIAPADEYQRKIPLLGRGVHWVFPLGLCGYNSPGRLYEICEYRQFANHLMKIPYLTIEKDMTTGEETYRVINAFQAVWFLKAEAEP